MMPWESGGLSTVPSGNTNYCQLSESLRWISFPVVLLGLSSSLRHVCKSVPSRRREGTLCSSPEAHSLSVSLCAAASFPGPCPPDFLHSGRLAESTGAPFPGKAVSSWTGIARSLPPAALGSLPYEGHRTSIAYSLLFPLRDQVSFIHFIQF